MAIPNFIALFALSGVVAKLTREHFANDLSKRK
jgi:Na+/alanine symporter